ncbi:hypothetical protein [Pseudoflavonifractor phocaeensis]|uniref:hypothetical protein n=1 Tax=Oscillospiraceae TaxID=216572 RepID=UPI00174B252B|nr:MULTISPECIES: hypothetical protein [Oscillospiraceae]MDM8239205.1 hypothetical protein [Pseudoflavonifractor phocaeensis]
MQNYLHSKNRGRGAESLRVSLYLDNAKCGDLHLFVIDFDKVDGKVDTQSAFFQEAKGLADRVTRSQGGGYHMFYGVDKKAAAPLFDSINLLTAEGTESFVCKTGCVTTDGRNKVDMFCDALHFIYEWEAWDNSLELTDKTQPLYELIKAHFQLKRPMDGSSGKRQSTGRNTPLLDKVSEESLRQEMTEKQQKVFDDLKTQSSDCSREQWFSIGIDIFHVFGAELGGKVFRWWSAPGHSFQPQGCARTWENICSRGPKTELKNSIWMELVAESAF